MRAPRSCHSIRTSATAATAGSVYRQAYDTTLDPARYPNVPNYTIRAQSTLRRPSFEYLGNNVLSVGRAGSQLTVSYGAQWQREAEVDDNTGDFTQHDTLNANNEAVFTELQGSFGSRLSIITGGRFEKHQGLPSALLPRGSVVVGVVPRWLSLRLAAGRAFLVPNISDRYLNVPGFQANPDLRPMKSLTWEVGATVTAPDRSVVLSLGYFHRRDNDFIRTVPADTGTNATSKNLGAAVAEGVEAELERHWSSRWRTGMNVAWLETKVLDNAGLDTTDYPNGSTLPAVPAVTGNLYVSSDLPRVATFARVTLVGSQTVLANRFYGPRVKIDPYALVEFVLQWHLRSTLNVYGRLGNLLNTRYQAAYDKPGVPRTVVLGVRTNL